VQYSGDDTWVVAGRATPVRPGEVRMRILFYYRGVESLGVGYLMSTLKHHGHQVDLLFDPGLDDNLFLRAPALRWLNRDEALMERARAFRPDLVCVSILTNLYPFVRNWCRRLKEELGVPIVAGGHHVQALPDYVLSNPDIDVICVGEGEIALLELVERMARSEDITSIPGLWVKAADGEIHRNPLGPLVENLDSLPFPEKDLWYEYGCFHGNLEVFTGRGCPFRCTFCNIHYQRSLFRGAGKFLRKRSVENVMAELRENLRRFDPKFVSLHDDNFTTVKSYVLEFCEAYRREVNLPWYCFAYPTTLTPELASAMKAANCRTIFMGVDSGDEEVRRRLMERPMTDQLIMEAARIVKQAGIGLQISCIYGSPTETPDQMFRTLEMVEKIQPMQSSSYVFYPFPKTKLYEIAVEAGELTPEGEQGVREGRSSYHHELVLDHPHKELAETLSKITPVYAKAPRFIRPVLRWMIRRRMKRSALFLYVMLIPIAFPSLGLEGVTITLKMAWRGLTQRPFKPPVSAPPGETEVL
jgi:anaerobic magnesium-protoporphyrin IX monomethyl ester cyclase